MKKYYYIEFTTVNSSGPYTMQSKWFKSEKKAIKWLKDSFDFFDDSEIDIYLMSATFNKNGDMVGDIEQEKYLFLREEY